MRARWNIENPDDMEATVKITMSVKEWKRLRDQLNNAWPSSRLGSAIDKVVTEANKTYTATEIDVS